jgi:hypothetical protein
MERQTPKRFAQLHPATQAWLRRFGATTPDRVAEAIEAGMISLHRSPSLSPAMFEEIKRWIAEHDAA